MLFIARYGDGPSTKGPEAEEECGGKKVLEAATSSFLFAYEVCSQRKGDQRLNRLMIFYVWCAIYLFHEERYAPTGP